MTQLCASRAHGWVDVGWSRYRQHPPINTARILKSIQPIIAAHLFLPDAVINLLYFGYVHRLYYQVHTYTTLKQASLCVSTLLSSTLLHNAEASVMLVCSNAGIHSINCAWLVTTEEDFWRWFFRAQANVSGITKPISNTDMQALRWFFVCFAAFWCSI